MASESSVTDQSIDEHAEEKKVDVSKYVDDEEIIFQPKEAAGNDEAANNKEDLTEMASTASVSDEKLEPDDVTVAEVTKKEEQEENVGEVKNSLQESEVSNSSEPAVETNEGTKQSQADGAHETPSEVQEKSSDFVETSASQEPVVSESRTEDLKHTEIKPTFENERKPEEAPLVSTGVDISKDGNVEGETLETTNPEFSKDKVDIELIKSEDSKDEIQVLVPSEIPTEVVPDVSETPEKNDVDSSNLTSIEVPVKDLEVEFGSPEEQKQTESTATKEPSSNVSIIDAGGEVAGSSYEANPSGVAEVVEKIDDGLEAETIHTSVKIQEDLEAKPELGQTQSDENVSQGVEVKKDDGIVDGDIETSAIPDGVPPLAEVSSEEEKASEPGAVVEEKEVETSSECENIDTVSKVAEVSLEGRNVLEGDELVDKDKFVNAEAVERELIDSFTDPTEAEVSSDQVKAPATTEIAKEALEVTSKELNIAPEASEIPSEGDKVSASDEEKSESLKGGDATSVEAPKDITTAEGSLDQVIGEKKSESSVSETEAEVSSDQLKAPTATEIVKEALEVTSKELNIAPEASEIPSEDDKISAGDEEKSESLNGEDATSVEAPKDITTVEASLDQVIEEKKSESSIRETQGPSEDKLVDKEKDLNEEAKEVNLQSQADGAHETLSVVQSDFGETSASQESVLSESKTENLNDIEIKPKSENERKPEEAPLVSTGVDFSEDGNVETGTQETANPESSEEKVDIELINSEDSKNEIQVFPTKIPTVVVPDASKTPEKNDVDLSNLTSIEVPVKDLEVESGSPEEHKPKESTETKEPSSNESKIDAGGEVVGSSYEAKPSGVAEVVEKKDGGLEVETIQTSVEIHEDLEAKPELAQTQYDENVSEGVEVKKEDEIVEGGIETSTVPDDVPSLAQVSSEEEKASEPGVVVEEEEISLEGDNVDNVLEGDTLVDKEKVVNTKAVERDLVDTFTDPAEAEVFSDQVKAHASSDEIKASATTEIVKEESEKEALEVTSKELNIAPEANEVPSEGDKLSAGDEKNERLKGEAATSVEAPKDITTAEESLDQVIEEKKSESSINEIQAPSEDKLVDKEKDANEEAKEISLQSQTDDAHETLSVVQSDFVETSASPEPVFSESKTEDLKDTEIKPTSENERKPVEAPLVSAGVDISGNGNVGAETQEATNPEFSKDKVDIELIKSEDSKDEIQVLAPAEIPSVVVPDASKTPERNDVDLSNLTSIEEPVKDLEVESGSPEEHKSKESTETKESSSNESKIDAGGEVVGSSYEAKPSGVAEVVEKKDGGLKVETIHTSVELHEDLEAKPQLAQTQSDENVSEGVEVKKDDEIVEGGIHTSTVPDDVPSLAKVSSEEEKASQPGVVVEEEEISLEGDNADTVPKVAEVSLEGVNVLEGDKLIDKEKVVNTKAVERDLVDAFTDPAEADVSSDKVKAPTFSDEIKASATSEIVKEESNKEALEVTSKELNIASEASEIPSEGDKLSAGDEKSESLQGEAATSVEAPKDITTAEESLDQVIEEKKSESSISEIQAPSEDKLVDKDKDVNEEALEISLQTQTDGAHETPSVVQSDFVETSASPEPVFSESKTEDLKDTEIKPTSANERKPVEAPLVSTGVDSSENGNVEAVTQEATKPEFSKDKVDIKLIKSEDLKDETQVLAPAEIPNVVFPDASKTPEKNDVDSSNLTSIEVPVKDLEVESGSPEEQKPKESTEAKEPSSNEGTIDAGGEVVGSSYEAKPSGVAEVVEKKDDSVGVETTPTSVEIHENLEAKPELAQTQSDENVSEGVEVKKDDEIVKGGIETSTVPDDVPPLVKVSSEEENASEPVVVVEEEDKTSLEVDSIDTVAEVSLEGRNILEGDKLIGKEKVVNSEAVERDLVDTFTDPAEAEVSSDHVKAPATTEIVKEESNKEALEVTSKELNIVPEAVEVPSEDDTFSAGDEKGESLIVGDATSVEAPKDIIAVNESVDQLFEEKKSESSASEMAAPTEDKLVDKEKNVNVEVEERDLINTSTDPTAAEVSSELVKAPEIVEVESYKHALEETSKELNIAPEASEVPSESDKLSAGNEKSESLKGEAATSVVAPKDITTVEESLDQVIEEKKNGGSVRETKAPSEDKFVDKATDVNIEAKERDLVDTSVDPPAAEVYSDEVEAPETVETVKYESNKQALEVTSKEPNIAAEAIEVPSEGDTISAGDEEKSESLKVEAATSVEASKYITATEESLDQVIEEKKSESFISKTGTSAEDRLVDNEKDIYVETIPRDLVDTSTDPTAAEVSSEQVKASETAEIAKEESDKQALEVISKELNITPEASEVSSEVDKVCAGDEEKSESLKGEDAISVEAPKDITTAEEWLDQVIKDKKSESSLSEMEAQAEDKLVEDQKDLVDTSTDPTAAEVSSDQVKALEVASKELNIASEASEVPSEGDEVSAGESLKGEDATSVEVPKDITIAEELPDQAIKPKKNESSKTEMEALVEDKLVDNEKDVNVEAEKKVLVDTSTDPSADEVSPEQVEASEVSSEGDKVSAGEEEKIESLKGEDATSMKAAPKDSPAAEDSTDQLIEESKSESTKSAMEAPIEITRDFDTSKLFPEAVKDIIASEAVEEKQDETSNDPNVEEKKASDSEDKKEEVKVEGALQNATDKPEQEELGDKKAESEKSKDQDPIVKLTKEVTKRESNIFSKVKRSIVKAKKAILRKSPGPKTRSSEAKDENT